MPQHSAASLDSESEEDMYSKEANPYARDCKQCKPLLSETVRKDPSLRHKTKEQLIDKIEDLRIKTRNQSVRLRHLDHELTDLQTAKDQMAVEAERAIDQEVRYSDRLEEFGLHPHQTAKKTSLKDEDLDVVSTNKFKFTEEEIDAINDIKFTLQLRRYDSKLAGHSHTIKTFFQQIKSIELSAADLTSYYDLAGTVLRAANMLSMDANVVLAVEMFPKMSDRAYFRVLHPGQFGVWMHGMKMLRGGDYKIVAYLYRTNEAESAYMRLEQEPGILKY